LIQQNLHQFDAFFLQNLQQDFRRFVFDRIWLFCLLQTGCNKHQAATNQQSNIYSGVKISLHWLVVTPLLYVAASSLN